MDFKSTKGIYLQISDKICDQILGGSLSPGERLPSVREQAAALGVNANTIMRTYSELQQMNIIANKRGVGYFVTEHAESEILKLRRRDFFDNMVPEFLHQASLLKISKEELFRIMNGG